MVDRDRKKDSRAGLDRRRQLPLQGKLLDRIKQAEVVLNAESRAEEKEVDPFSPKPLPHSKLPPVSFPHSESSSTLNSQPGIPTLPFLSSVCSSLLSDLIEKEVGRVASEVGRGTFKDMIGATLMLHSNFMLDSIIATAMTIEIPICAKEAYNEELDIEYIYFQQELLSIAIQRECKSSALLWALEVIAEEITLSYTHQIPLHPYILEAMHEEQQLNIDMMETIYDDIVLSLVNSEWLELLAEDEYSHSMMEERFNDLPQGLVLKLMKEEPEKHLMRMAEHIYVGWLYEYVSGKWLERVVREEVEGRKERDEDTFYIEPPPVDPLPVKRAPKFKASYYD